MAASLETIEAQFAEAAGNMHTKVVDLNETMQAVNMEWMKLMKMRMQLLSMYGMPVEESFASMMDSVKTGGREPRAPGSAPSTTSGASKKKRKAEKIAQAQGMSTMGGSAFIDTSGIALNTGKAGGKAGNGGKAGGKASGKGGGKAPQTSAHNLPGADHGPKGKVIAALQVLLERSLTKEDTVYTASPQSAAGSHVVALTFPTYDPSQSFEGHGSTAKEAENAAGAQALAWIQPIVEPMMEEYRAKRARREEERLATKKAKAEAKAAAEGLAAQ